MRKMKSTSVHNIITNERQKKQKIDHFVEIMKLFSQLDHTSDNLDQKIGTILKSQESSFIRSYQNHMKRIKEQFKLLQNEIEIKNKKIQEYQSNGHISSLIKRIKFLQSQEAKLLNALEKKNINIKQLSLEKQINKSQNRRLQEKVKQLFRVRAINNQRTTQNTVDYQSLATFSTQLSPEIEKIDLSKINKYTKIIKPKRSVKLNSQSNSQFDMQHSLFQMQKQISMLTKQNKRLVAMNNRIRTQYQQTQNFFFNIVSEMRKNITVRKKLKFCTFEDFRKEDKIQLLIKILSNDQILLHLYNKIFPKSSLLQQQRQTLTDHKQKQRRSSIHILPNLNSMRFL